MAVALKNEDKGTKKGFMVMSEAPVETLNALEPHLETEDFSVFYGRSEAVKKATLAIPRGEVTAIIGPSGCGKSTFLRAINRMNDLIPSCRADASTTGSPSASSQPST